MPNELGESQELAGEIDNNWKGRRGDGSEADVKFLLLLRQQPRSLRKKVIYGLAKNPKHYTNILSGRKKGTGLIPG